MIWTQPSGPLCLWQCFDFHAFICCQIVPLSLWTPYYSVLCNANIHFLAEIWYFSSESNILDPILIRPSTLIYVQGNQEKGDLLIFPNCWLLIVDQHVHSSRWGDYAHSQHAFPFINNFPTICLESFWKAKYTTSKAISVDKKIVVYGGGFTDIEHFGVNLVSSKMF